MQEVSVDNLPFTSSIDDLLSRYVRHAASASQAQASHIEQQFEAFGRKDATLGVLYSMRDAFGGDTEVHVCEHPNFPAYHTRSVVARWMKDSVSKKAA